MGVFFVIYGAVLIGYGFKRIFEEKERVDALEEKLDCLEGYIAKKEKEEEQASAATAAH